MPPFQIPVSLNHIPQMKSKLHHPLFLVTSVFGMVCLGACDNNSSGNHAGENSNGAKETRTGPGPGGAWDGKGASSEARAGKEPQDAPPGDTTGTSR